MRDSTVRGTAAALLAITGCGPALGGGESSSSGADETSSIEIVVPSAEHEESSSDDTGGAVFILTPDGPGVCDYPCDPWSQDCPTGDKCVPGFYDTICAPLVRSPIPIGSPCTVELAEKLALDDCEVGALCWHVEPDTNIGTCVEMCSPPSYDPICETPGTACAIAQDGMLLLCLTPCDPALPECDDAETCQSTGELSFCLPT